MRQLLVILLSLIIATTAQAEWNPWAMDSDPIPTNPTAQTYEQENTKRLVCENPNNLPKVLEQFTSVEDFLDKLQYSAINKSRDCSFKVPSPGLEVEGRAFYTNRYGVIFRIGESTEGFEVVKAFSGKTWFVFGVSDSINYLAPRTCIVRERGDKLIRRFDFIIPLLNCRPDLIH